MDLDSLVNQPNQPVWIKGKFQFSERPHLKALRQTAIEKGTQHPSLASAYVHTGMCTPPPTPPHKIGHEPKVKEQKTKFPRMYTLRRKKHDWNIYAETWTYIHIQEQKIKLAKIKLLQSQKTIELKERKVVTHPQLIEAIGIPMVLSLECCNNTCSMSCQMTQVTWYTLYITV